MTSSEKEVADVWEAPRDEGEYQQPIDVFRDQAQNAATAGERAFWQEMVELAEDSHQRDRVHRALVALTAILVVATIIGIVLAL